MLGAPVPKAPVDEHGDALTRKHDVGATSQPGEGLRVDAIPQPAGVQDPPERQLGRGVSDPLAAEPSADRRVRSLWRRAWPAERRSHAGSVPWRGPGLASASDTARMSAVLS